MKKLLCLAVLLSISGFAGTACKDDHDEEDSSETATALRTLTGEYTGMVTYRITLTFGDGDPASGDLVEPLESYTITAGSNNTADIRIV